MPSTNSSALRLQFEQMAKRLSESHDFGLDGMRDMSDQLARRQQEPTGVTYEEIGIGDRTAVWTRPLHADSGHALLYFHGGGYVTFSADTDRKLIGHLAKAAGAWALAPDYRLAPEHVFPAQLKDGLDAYRWLLDHGYDHHRIALAGESAGGNLALATAVKLRDDGLPMPAAVIAFPRGWTSTAPPAPSTPTPTRTPSSTAT